MPTLNLAYIAELAFKYIRKFAYIAFLLPFFLAVTAMWTSSVTAFLYFYNLNYVDYPISSKRRSISS